MVVIKVVIDMVVRGTGIVEKGVVVAMAVTFVVIVVVVIVVISLIGIPLGIVVIALDKRAFYNNRSNPPLLLNLLHYIP